MSFIDRIPDPPALIKSGDRDSDPFLDRAARWANQLTYREIPKPVRRCSKMQLTGSIAAALWTRTHPLGDRIRATIETDADDGQATSLAGAKASPETAASSNAALASGLNFDDAILGGYSGRSSVFVPLAYAEAGEMDGRRLIVAQTAANEIASRIGAAAAIGQFDEEQAAYIHAAGAAVGRCVIEGDSAETLIDALGTALSHPPQSLEPSIFGAETRIWGASEAIRNGIAAVDSARSGITARSDLLEGDGGLLETVPERPSPAYLSGLGDHWHTRTLTVKQFPGSTLVAAPIEAALEARGRFDRGRTAVRTVDVFVPWETIDSATRADRYGGDQDRSWPTVSRSVPHRVAATLVDGEPTPKRVGARTEAIRSITERVTVQHDPRLTIEAVTSEAQTSVTLGDGRLATVRAVGRLGPKTSLRHLPTVLRAGRPRSPPETTASAERRFGARLVVTTASGRTIETAVDRPAGFAGAPPAERRAIARRKCRLGLEALGVDEPTARRHTESLLAIEASETVSIARVLEAVDERDDNT